MCVHRHGGRRLHPWRMCTPSGCYSGRRARRHSFWHSSVQPAYSPRCQLAGQLASVPALRAMMRTPAWRPAVRSSPHARPQSCVHIGTAAGGFVLASVHVHAPGRSIWTPGASAQLLAQLRSARLLALPSARQPARLGACVASHDAHACMLAEGWIFRTRETSAARTHRHVDWMLSLRTHRRGSQRLAPQCMQWPLPRALKGMAAGGCILMACMVYSRGHACWQLDVGPSVHWRPPLRTLMSMAAGG